MPHVAFVGAETPDEMPLPLCGVPVDVILVDASDEVSQKTGDPMIKLQLKVHAPDADYDGMVVYDYLTNPETSQRTKIAAKKIGRAFGLSDADMSKGVDFPDFIGKDLQVVLAKKAATEQYPEGRNVKAYVPA